MTNEQLKQWREDLIEDMTDKALIKCSQNKFPEEARYELRLEYPHIASSIIADAVKRAQKIQGWPSRAELMNE